MQATIKDNKLIASISIDDRDKEELLNFINKSKNKGLLSEPLYNINGDISGIAISIK